MIKLVTEALGVYFNVVTAFWHGVSRGGGLQLLLFGLALWWLFGGRIRCRCGCWCGRCKCDEVRVEDED